MPDQDTTRAWNRFSADFKVPDSDDAARIATEVRASINDWVTKSLADMQADMTNRMNQQLSTFKQNIDQSRMALENVKTQFDLIQTGLDNLKLADPTLDAKVQDLKSKTAAARQAMEDTAKQWEQKGAEAVDTAVGIAKTIAMFV